MDLPADSVAVHKQHSARSSSSHRRHHHHHRRKSSASATVRERAASSSTIMALHQADENDADSIPLAEPQEGSAAVTADNPTVPIDVAKFLISHSTKITQENIKKLSSFILHKKAEHGRMVSGWLMAFKICPANQQVALFYAVNEVLQTCRRKDAEIYRKTFPKALQLALCIIRDYGCFSSLNRLFGIWSDRGTLPAEIITTMRVTLQNAVERAKRHFNDRGAPYAFKSLQQHVDEHQKLAAQSKLAENEMICDSYCRPNSADCDADRLIDMIKDRETGQKSILPNCIAAVGKCENASRSCDMQLRKAVQCLDAVDDAVVHEVMRTYECKIVTNAFADYYERLKDVQEIVEKHLEIVKPNSALINKPSGKNNNAANIDSSKLSSHTNDETLLLEQANQDTLLARFQNVTGDLLTSTSSNNDSGINNSSSSGAAGGGDIETIEMDISDESIAAPVENSNMTSSANNLQSTVADMSSLLLGPNNNAVAAIRAALGSVSSLLANNAGNTVDGLQQATQTPGVSQRMLFPQQSPHATTIPGGVPVFNNINNNAVQPAVNVPQPERFPLLPQFVGLHGMSVVDNSIRHMPARRPLLLTPTPPAAAALMQQSPMGFPPPRQFPFGQPAHFYGAGIQQQFNMPVGVAAFPPYQQPMPQFAHLQQQSQQHSMQQQQSIGMPNINVSTAVLTPTNAVAPGPFIPQTILAPNSVAVDNDGKMSESEQQQISTTAGDPRGPRAPRAVIPVNNTPVMQTGSSANVNNNNSHAGNYHNKADAKNHSEADDEEEVKRFLYGAGSSRKSGATSNSSESSSKRQRTQSPPTYSRADDNDVDRRTRERKSTADSSSNSWKHRDRASNDQSSARKVPLEVEAAYGSTAKSRDRHFSDAGSRSSPPSSSTSNNRRNSERRPYDRQENSSSENRRNEDNKRQKEKLNNNNEITPVSKKPVDKTIALNRYSNSDRRDDSNTDDDSGKPKLASTIVSPPPSTSSWSKQRPETKKVFDRRDTVRNSPPYKNQSSFPPPPAWLDFGRNEFRQSKKTDIDGGGDRHRDIAADVAVSSPPRQPQLATVAVVVSGVGLLPSDMKNISSSSKRRSSKTDSCAVTDDDERRLSTTKQRRRSSPVLLTNSKFSSSHSTTKVAVELDNKTKPLVVSASPPHGQFHTTSRARGTLSPHRASNRSDQSRRHHHYADTDDHHCTHNAGSKDRRHVSGSDSSSAADSAGGGSSSGGGGRENGGKLSSTVVVCTNTDLSRTTTVERVKTVNDKDRRDRRR